MDDEPIANIDPLASRSCTVCGERASFGFGAPGIGRARAAWATRCFKGVGAYFPQAAY